jgi:hypothetical protein
MAAPSRPTYAFALSELALYHRNPNLGNVPKIAASLRAHGQYKPITINKGTHTGRPNEVLAGNHTLKAMRDLLAENPDDRRWHTIDGYVVDVDDDEATRIVLDDNKTAQDGFGYDQRLLADLLAGLPDLDGTAFTPDEYSDILAGLEEALPSGLGDDNDAKLPRTGPDGLIASKDLNAQVDTYLESSTRLVVLTVPIPQFVWMQGVLTRYREQHDLVSNTEAVLSLLEQWSGETAPEAPAAETEPIL